MNLKIPDQINYECTGCGKCCGGWAVPLTDSDYERISAINWAVLEPALKDKELFRSLKTNEKINTPYTHAINPAPSGQCPFLKDNLCFIHSQFGPRVKPAICQLFPYSFNETPDGVYATVSFISRGAILNAGRSLIEQRNYLQCKYDEFVKLFPNHHPNWSSIRLSSNIPLDWSRYLEIERDLLAVMQDKNKSLENRFIESSEYLDTLVLKGTEVGMHQDSANTGNKTLNRWDKILLTTLYKKYFPQNRASGKSYGQINLDLGSFVGANLFANDFGAALGKAEKMPWTEEHDIDDLIYRFFYSRIFAKLYFGAGFGQLSVIAGFNHLAVLLTLFKLKVRQLAIAHSSSTISMDDATTAIVQLEKSLGELKISPYGAAVLELLLNSPVRVARLMTL